MPEVEQERASGRTDGGWARALRAGALLLAGLPVAGLTPAAAGDRALIEFIGYSHDLGSLVFEEYGVSDGVNLAYSNIYVVDLASGAFSHGSPFRAEATEDGQETLWEMRAKAELKARDALAGLEPDVPVEIEALSGDGEIGPATTMRFGLPVYGPPGSTQGDYTLSLRTFDLPATQKCDATVAAPIKGFALTLSGDGAPREIHRDASTLPEWRGCPVDARLYAVVLPHETGDLGAGAAIVSYYPFDFEGASRRFMAVPLRAPEN